MVQVYGQEKIMVLKEIPIQNVSDPLLPHQVQCDVACLVYDVGNEKSFEYVARIYIVSYLLFYMFYWCRKLLFLTYRNIMQKVKFQF